MCGIAGLILPESQGSDSVQRAMRPMLQSLKSRGPDAEGVSAIRAPSWIGELGHRRLSIIDVEGGAQPLKIDGDRLQITFNGEIFNFRELKNSLEARGEKFTSRSDTEVALRLFKQKREKSFVELNGMFALGIWDEADRSLYLARDRVGIKPLYYASLEDGSLLFASDLMTLVRSGKISLELSAEAVPNYFFSEYLQAPHTIFRQVRKLPPGSYVRWRDGKVDGPHFFWSNETLLETRPTSFAEAYSGFVEHLEASVDRQLIADVPVGILLSGGLDSTAVTRMAAQKSKNLQSFCVEFKDPEFNEGPVARQVAAQLKTEHNILSLDENDLLENLDRALGSLDEPMGDPSIIPTFLLCEMAARKVKVVLGGDGGDELFGGYPTYLAHQFARPYNLMPNFLHSGVVRPLVNALPSTQGRWSLDWKLKRFFGRFDFDPSLRHLRWMSGSDLPLVRELFGHDLSPWTTHNLPRRLSTDLKKYMWMDFTTYLPSEVLVKVDRASMAHGLEVRPPFLDNEMMAWAFHLPDKLKISKGKTKILIREYLRREVGPWVAEIPKKGFGIPLNRWLKTSLRGRTEKMIHASPIYEKTSLNPQAMKKIWTEHLEGRQDHSRTLWSFLVLDHWMKRVY